MPVGDVAVVPVCRNVLGRMLLKLLEGRGSSPGLSVWNGVKARRVFCSQFSLFFSDCGISSATAHPATCISHLCALGWHVSLSLCCHHHSHHSTLVPRIRSPSSAPLSFILSWEMLQ